MSRLLVLLVVLCTAVLIAASNAQDGVQERSSLSTSAILKPSVLKLKPSDALLDQYIARHMLEKEYSSDRPSTHTNGASSRRGSAKVSYPVGASEGKYTGEVETSTFASVKVTVSGSAPPQISPAVKKSQGSSTESDSVPTAADLRRAHFGQSLCFSADGTTFVVGANMFVQPQGAVIVYEFDGGSASESSTDSGGSGASSSRRRRRIFGENRVPSSWKETLLTVNDASAISSSSHRPTRKARNPAYSASGGSSGGRGGLGFACAISADGNAIAVSSPSGHGDSESSSALSDGFVVTFVRDAETGTWRRRDEKLVSQLDVPRHRKVNNAFGWALSASGDGRVLAVSAKGTWNHNGAVELFTCEIGFEACVYAQGLQPPDETNLVGPRGIRIRNNFAISLALSADASTLVVGSTGYEYEQGIVYVYRNQQKAADGADGRRKAEFELSARLFSGDAQRYGYFGFKVAVDARGLVIVAGADGEDEYRGAAYTFHRDSEISDAWSAPVLLLKPEGERLQEDNFGGSVGLSGDGSVLAVGAPGAKLNDESDHGALYVYEALGTGKWELSRTLRRDAGESRSGDLFAWSASIDYEGAHIAAGAPEADETDGVAMLCTFRKSGRRSPSTETLVHDDIVNYYAEPGVIKPAPELDRDEL
mmetsp:Transcript_1246/g.2518  ORF Transcript_1246/g.2518 Transcript_1246/m.2518 type:complete len:651 (-) Transcript_1246:1250-3202(-)